MVGVTDSKTGVNGAFAVHKTIAPAYRSYC